jgi:hypothetical protein
MSYLSLAPGYICDQAGALRLGEIPGKIGVSARVKVGRNTKRYMGRYMSAEMRLVHSMLVD